MLLVERTVAVVVLWTASTWRPGLRVSRTCFKDLFAFGVNIMGTNLLDYVNSRSDNLIIGYALGAEMLGFYEIAYRLYSTATHLLTNTVSSVAFSAFSRVQNDPERMRKGFYTAIRIAAVVAFPVFLGAAAVAPDLIETFFGAKWLPQSARVFQILAFVGILHALFYFNSAVMLASGKPSWRLGITVLNATANVVAFALVVHWGIAAVAAAYVLRGYLLAPIPLWAVWRLIRIRGRRYLRELAAPLVSALVMAGGVVGVRMMLADALTAAPRLALCVLVGAALYLGSMALLDLARLQQMRRLVVAVLPNRTS
jgi:PST family polysaccharide transporter